MCKESPERGLGRLYHGTAEREKAKRAEPLKRGRFVPEASDGARLLPRLAECARRS